MSVFVYNVSLSVSSFRSVVAVAFPCVVCLYVQGTGAIITVRLCIGCRRRVRRRKTDFFSSSKWNWAASNNALL